VSQSSDFCHHNPLCCFSTSVYYCCLFHYQLSPGTFGYTPVIKYNGIHSKVLQWAMNHYNQWNSMVQSSSLCSP